MNPSVPARHFREHTDLDQLKRQAKELLAAFRRGEGAATTEVHAHYRGADVASFALHDAQLVLARAYGFASWARLKAYVDGVTARHLIDAVRAGDLEKAEAMLRARPELANMGRGQDERLAIHYAVLDRSAAMTRLLMRYGADARAGVHPHREATTALTLASERGYDEIVTIIRDEEQRRRAAHDRDAAAAPDDLFLVANWENGRALQTLKANPTLIHSTSPNGGTPLHAAACELHEQAIAWLLDQDADPNYRLRGKWTPIDLAAARTGWHESDRPAKFERIARLLLSRGAGLGTYSAVALGDAGWIRAHHADGTLEMPAECDRDAGCVGLLEVAVWHNRPEMLALLLDLGFDPNERLRAGGADEPVYSAGGPLFCCVVKGNRRMAEMLLAKGADPNVNVYTAGTPFYRAHAQNNSEFVTLLEQHGGFLDAISAGFAHHTEAARRLLDDEAAGRLRAGAVLPGSTVAEDLLATAAGGGSPEIVRLALERIDWPRNDERWMWALWQAFTCDAGLERGLECFRLLLDRADPNLGASSRTMLHTIMARGGREHVPMAELLLDRGARVDIRDELLKSTPLGWACRWGRVHFVELLLERGADPLEKDAEPWATPMAWAQKMRHENVLKVLRTHSHG
jgi:ankyrin repeat protein